MTQSAVPFSSRIRAVLILLFLCGVFVAGLYSSRASSPTRSVPVRTDGDVAMYTAMVQRLSAGEQYYDVVGGELRQRGYATRPFFNWRTPLLFSAVALAPRVARVVLISLGLILLVATITRFAAEPSLVAVASLVAQIGALPITLVPGSVVLHEAWTGVFIGLSVWLYLRGSWRLAALVGLLALFVRELAAPYCVVATLLAIRARRWAEVRVWMVGSALYAVYLGLHVKAVLAHGQPGDIEHLESWVRFGGLRFLLSTLAWNGWLTAAPHWVALVPLVVLLTGVFDRRLNPHVRFAVAAYFAFFCVAGHDFNDYWGAVPLLTYPLLFGYALRSAVDLTRTAFGKFQVE
jgi:hypothetical protein